MNLKQRLIAVRERREFDRGYAYADEQLALGALPAELERQADDAWEVTPFDRGIGAALRKHSAKKVDYTDLAPELQVAFEESLDKDQIDLSLTIRNTHVSSLMQHDMDTWARIAQRLEMARDINAARFKADLAKTREQLTESQLVRDAAIADLTAEQRSKRHWRVAASLLGFAWALFAVLLLTGCDSPPTVTMPLSWCHDQPTGDWRHQHRSAYTTVVIVNKVPITQFHPSRDWDEQRYIRTCAAQDWRTDRKVER